MKTYTFKKQIKNRGCYVEILFDIIYEESVSDELIVEYKASPEWEQICRAGILIFYDYFKRVRTGRIEITIYEINWLQVDTNNLIVLFASVCALLEDLNIGIMDLKFDTINEGFFFPEIRKIDDL